MRGADEQTGALFSYQSPDAMVPKDHPLRVIRPLVNAALTRLSPDFERLGASISQWAMAMTRTISVTCRGFSLHCAAARPISSLAIA